MRITQNITYNTYVNDMMRRQESLYGIDKQISTGKRINTASDDPVNANNILTSKSLLSSFEQYGRNIDYGLSYLNITEKSLDRAKDVLSRIQELAVTASTGTADGSSRSMIASEVNNLYDELVSIGNTNFDGKYIFSGYKTDTAAFSSSGAYQGDANSQQIKISAGSNLTLGVNGGEVFKGIGGGTDILQAVSDLASALSANDTAGIKSSIGTLESSYSQVSNAVSDIGGKVSRLTASSDDLTMFKLEVKSLISGMEDADLTKLISELKVNQVALEASLASASKIFSVNIFDYL